MTDEEKQRHDLEVEQVRATIAHLNAQTAKLSKETRWYEAFVGAAIFAAAAAFVKLFL